MATYKVMSLEIKKITKGPNQGQDFILGTLTNMLDPWGAPIAYTEFNTLQIALMRKYIPKSKGGDFEGEDLNLPPEFATLKGMVMTYVPPAREVPFVRLYTTTDPKRGWTAGKAVCDKRTGKPILHETLRVWCRYYIDEDAPERIVYPAGCSPQARGEQEFRAFYMSYQDYCEKEGIAQPNPNGTSADALVQDEAAASPLPANALTDPNTGKHYVIDNGAVKWLD